MKARSLILMAFAAGLALAGCQREADDGPTKLSGRIFVFNYRLSAATYMITLQKITPIPEGAVAVAEFENPMGGDPLVIKQKIYPFWDKITLESPDIHCVRKDHPYSVSIRLVDAGEKTIQTIKTSVKSNFDQSILAARPLVLGPAYDKNPDVFKPDGSADFSPEASCPAA
jgi:hypothetical protein